MGIKEIMGLDYLSPLFVPKRGINIGKLRRNVKDGNYEKGTCRIFEGFTYKYSFS